MGYLHLIFNFRDIKVDFKKNLVKIDHTKKEATFETIGSDPAETEVSQVQTHRFIDKQKLSA